MLLEFLTGTCIDPKVVAIQSLFSYAKKAAVLVNGGSKVDNELKLIGLVERLFIKFIQDNCRLKIDRGTMNIFAEINEILDKHNKKCSCCKSNNRQTKHVDESSDTCDTSDTATSCSSDF